MFRKNTDVNERGRQTLRGKETRKLIIDILKQLPLIKDDELTLLINNKSNVIQVKLTSPERINLYIVDNIPLFYSVEDKQQLHIYPTVFTLWKLPHALR